MQYLLTQEEYERLARAESEALRVSGLEDALEIAKAEILRLSGFDCIHDEKGNSFGGYCGECPCSKSSHKWDRSWDQVCTDRKRYSK